MSLKLPGPQGLPNIGNTCYLNSCLQCLAFTLHLDYNSPSVLIRFLWSLRYGIWLESKLKGEIHDILLQLLPSKFHGKSQMCAHDCLCYLLSHLEYTDTHLHATLQMETCTEVVCMFCKQKSTSSHAETGISIPIRATLEESYQAFANSEFCNGYRCAKCNRGNMCWKRTTVAKCLDVIIMHIKRFSRDGRKDNMPFLVSVDLAFDDVAYRLASMILHTGSIDAGHYVSVVRRKDDWWLLDDAKEPQSCTMEDVVRLGSAAYIVFYEKMII